ISRRFLPRLRNASTRHLTFSVALNGDILDAPFGRSVGRLRHKYPAGVRAVAGLAGGRILIGIKQATAMGDAVALPVFGSFRSTRVYAAVAQRALRLHLDASDTLFDFP